MPETAARILTPLKPYSQLGGLEIQSWIVGRAIEKAALLGRMTGTAAVPLVISARAAEGLDLRTARVVTVPTEEALQASAQEEA